MHSRSGRLGSLEPVESRVPQGPSFQVHWSIPSARKLRVNVRVMPHLGSQPSELRHSDLACLDGKEERFWLTIRGRQLLLQTTIKLEYSTEALW